MFIFSLSEFWNTPSLRPWKPETRSRSSGWNMGANFFKVGRSEDGAELLPLSWTNAWIPGSLKILLLWMFLKGIVLTTSESNRWRRPTLREDPEMKIDLNSWLHSFFRERYGRQCYITNKNTSLHSLTVTKGGTFDPHLKTTCGIKCYTSELNNRHWFYSWYFITDRIILAHQNWSLLIVAKAWDIPSLLCINNCALLISVKHNHYRLPPLLHLCISRYLHIVHPYYSWSSIWRSTSEHEILLYKYLSFILSICSYYLNNRWFARQCSSCILTGYHHTSECYGTY